MREFLSNNRLRNADGEEYFNVMERTVYYNDPIGSDWDLSFEDLPGGYGRFNKTFECWYKQMGYPIIRIHEDSGVLT